MAGSIEKREKTHIGQQYHVAITQMVNLQNTPKQCIAQKEEAEIELTKFVTKVQSGMVANGKL